MSINLLTHYTVASAWKGCGLLLNTLICWVYTAQCFLNISKEIQAVCLFSAVINLHCNCNRLFQIVWDMPMYCWQHLKEWAEFHVICTLSEMLICNSCVFVYHVCFVHLQHVDGSFSVKPLKQKQIVSLNFHIVLFVAFHNQVPNRNGNMFIIFFP